MSTESEIRSIFEGELSEELRRIFTVELEKMYGSGWWEKAVVPRLKDDDQRRLMYRDDATLEDVDFPVLLTLAYNEQKLQNLRPTEPGFKAVISEGHQVRNRWAHKTGKDKSVLQEIRDYDTLRILAEGFGCSAVLIERIQHLHNDLAGAYFAQTGSKPTYEVPTLQVTEQNLDGNAIVTESLLEDTASINSILRESLNTASPDPSGCTENMSTGCITDSETTEIHVEDRSNPNCATQKLEYSVSSARHFIIANRRILVLTAVLLVAIIAGVVAMLPTPPTRDQILSELTTYDIVGFDPDCTMEEADSLIKANLLPSPCKTELSKSIRDWQKKLPCFEGMDTTKIEQIIRTRFEEHL